MLRSNHILCIFATFALAGMPCSNMRASDNDNFANRAPLSGADPIQAAGDNTNATREPFEQVHAGYPSNNSIWYSWTATQSAPVTINTFKVAGSSLATLLAVYTGSTLQTLSLVASDTAIQDVTEQSTGAVLSYVAFNAVSGTTYQIAVDGYKDTAGPTMVNITYLPLINNIDRPLAATLNQLFEYTLTASGTVTSFSATGLPPNVSMNAITGEITGKPGDVGTYSALISATGPSGSGKAILTIVVSTGPANDNFANRIALGGALPITATGNNLSATKEQGEQDHVESVASSSVWWSWTSTENGYVSINTFGSNCDLVLSVYTGSQLTALNLITENYPVSASDRSRRVATFIAQQGVQYEICVDGYVGSQGTIQLSLSAGPQIKSESTLNIGSGEPVLFSVTASGAQNTFSATGLPPGLLINSITGVISGSTTVVGTTSANLTVTSPYGTVTGALQVVVTITPANDTFAKASVISASIPATVFGTNVGATLEASEPTHFGNTGSVWWSWTPVNTGNYEINTIGSPFDAVLEVYTGSKLTNLQLVVDNGFAINTSVTGSALSSSVFLSAVAGTTYWICVTGLNGATGSVTLNIPATPSITSPLVQATGTGVPFVYKLAATNGPVTYSVSNLPAGLSFDSGKSAISGAPTYSGVFLIILTVSNSAGSTTSNLLLTVTPPPPNDNFANATAITGALPLFVNGYNKGATAEPGEPLPAGIALSHSVWYKWMATVTGNINIETSSNETGPFWTIYTGNSITKLVEVASSTAGLVNVQVTSGVVYYIYIVVDNSSTGGNFQLGLTQGPVLSPNNFLIEPIGVSTTYSLSATGAEITYTIDFLPQGLSLNPSTGIISGIPKQAGIFKVNATATNAFGSSAQTFIIEIGRLPVITSELAVTVSKGQNLNYLATADGSSMIQFLFTGLPDGVLDVTNGTIAGAPTSAGLTDIIILATNDFGSATANIRLKISTADSIIPPSIDAIIISPNPTLVGENVTFLIQGTSPSKALLSANWTFGDGSAASGLIVEHVYSAPGRYLVTTQLSDGDNTITNTSHITVVASATAEVMKLSRFNASFSFSTDNKDFLIIAGSIPVSVAATAASQQVNLIIGSLNTEFIVDSKGRSSVIKISKATGKFVISIKKAALFDSVVELGFTNSPVSKMNIIVPVVLGIGGQFFTANITVVYSATSKGGKGHPVQKL